MFSKQTAQDLHYSAILADIDGFDKAADKFFAEGGQGLNVTVPFKRDAFDYASRTTVRATAAKAVNTLILEQDGSITGDNTDGIGLANDILNNLGWEIKAKRLLVLGAGGAVQGILEPLLDLQPQHIVIANRSVDKALRLAKQFS
jgi:shikimate dehydrogenase